MCVLTLLSCNIDMLCYNVSYPFLITYFVILKIMNMYDHINDVLAYISADNITDMTLHIADADSNVKTENLFVQYRPLGLIAVELKEAVADKCRVIDDLEHKCRDHHFAHLTIPSPTVFTDGVGRDNSLTCCYKAFGKSIQ